MARKDVAFKIRIDEELRRAFVEACREQDRPAAQVVREFMREYVAAGRGRVADKGQPQASVRRDRREDRKTED